MRLHNSTEMSSSSYHERQFIIRYQEHIRKTPKKNKKRYSVIQNHETTRLYISSEADVDKVGRSMISQRQKHQVPQSRLKKRVNLVTPDLIFKSMTEVIEENNNNGENNVVGPVNIVNKRQEKQMPRIPIQYNDEKTNGLLADLQRLKVVYRGYAPKNTYYFFKSLTSKSNFVDIKSKSRSEFELQFNSKFESGNLSAAARKSQKQYWLYMRQDTNTNGLRQWYNFTIFNRKPGIFKFRIYKFSKYYSLYKDGMKPFIRDDHEEKQWRQNGSNVKYQYDYEVKCHYLEFQYEFKDIFMNTQFAVQPPYTYSMLKTYLQSISLKHPLLKLKKAGTSLAGLQIPIIEIKNNSDSNSKKDAIFIISRTHPGETASNYALEGFIQRLFQLEILLHTFDFYIIPMVNPDGVFLGNHRTGVMGKDLNRNFNSNQIQFYPEIDIVQKQIQRVKNTQNLAFLFDLHGHSAKRNIFAYGDEHLIGSLPYMQAHIIPKLLNDNISIFKYASCVYKSSKEKKNTARVFLSRKYKINAITFEQSYGLIDEGSIGIKNWINFGIAIANAFKQYVQVCQNGKPQKMAEYLSDIMIVQRQKKQKKMKKKMQILQLNLQRQNKLKQQQALIQKDEFKKFKTENNFQKQQVIKQCQTLNRPRRKNSLSSINSEELSSGDEDLENDQIGMQILKKQLIKIGCLKEGAKREKYNLAQKRIQIRGNYEPRLHQQKSSMIPRILKYQMKKKEEEKILTYNFQRQSQEKTRKNRSKMAERSQRESVQLPYLKR